MRYELLNLGCGETVTIYLPGMVCERVKVKKITYDSVTVVDRNGRCLELDKGAIEGLEKHFTIWNILKPILKFILGIGVVFYPDCAAILCSLVLLGNEVTISDPLYLYILAYILFYASAIWSLNILWKYKLINIYDRDNL